jgi:hypothetical protein
MICTPHHILFGRSKREECNGRDMWNVRGKIGVYRVLAERPAGKMPLGRPRRRWEDNIKMDLQKGDGRGGGGGVLDRSG